MKTIKQLKKQQRLGIVPTGGPRDTQNLDQSNLNQQVEALARARAREIIAEQQQAQILARNGRTFTKFDTVNDIIDSQTRS